MQRIVVLGPGASGKSTFCRALGAATGIPCTELDSVFWSPELEPTPPERWAEIQQELVTADAWILDGDLGPYDVVDVRLRRADAVVVLDVATWRCAWRAVRRSRARLDFWRWLLSWRRRYRPALLDAIRVHAPNAELFVARTPADIERTTAHIAGRR